MAAVDGSMIAAVDSRTDHHHHPSPAQLLVEQQQASNNDKDNVNNNAGTRPACFNSTVQECLCVLTATMSIGMSSFLYGICTVITAPIGRSLHMTAAQITWINASSS